MKKRFDDLVEILNRLRGENGCPWDKEQDPVSLKPFLIEETYEVLDAIDENNPDNIKEELGDLLYQIIFHAKIWEERGIFNIEDVIGAINDKMIRRHPHVFGSENISDSKDVLYKWEAMKKKEGGEKTIMDSIPKTLPSMLKAYKIQNKAARVGFDWDDPKEIFDKLTEEVIEFKEVCDSEDKASKEEEMGDIFFVLINLSRRYGINPEEALQKSIAKFIKRFKLMEKALFSDGKNFNDISKEEMEILWEDAKKALKLLTPK